MDALKDEESIYSRQTVRDDIDTLSKEGYDIETIVSSGNYYYFGDREFTLEELRVMGDAVASSRFIGKKQKASILKKLKGFCSKYQADTVGRHLISIEPRDSDDARIYAKVDLINDAINQGRRITFVLSEQVDGKRRKADSGENMSCTPLDLVWDGREFYLIALSDPDGEAVLYAVKRLAKLSILEKEGAARPAGFKAEKFAREKLSPGRGEKED